jgi:hypothetical protein
MNGPVMFAIILPELPPASHVKNAKILLKIANQNREARKIGIEPLFSATITFGVGQKTRFFRAK